MEKPTTYYTSVGFRCLRNIQKQTNDLYLVHCGHQQCPPGYTYDQKIPNEYHLHFVLNGKGTICLRKNTYHVKKGDLFLIMKGVAINYYADAQHPWEYMWVTFDGEKASDYVSQIGFSEDYPVIPSSIPTSTYLPVIEKILDTNILTPPNEIKRVGYLYHLLSILIEAKSSEKDRVRRYDYPSETYVEYALQYISLNYTRSIRINDLANHIGINRSYLTSIFKKELSISPQEYLLNYRLQKAAELIKTTDLSIQEISGMVGYENQFNFSKMFKNMYGVSPRNYRMQPSGYTTE